MKPVQAHTPCTLCLKKGNSKSPWWWQTFNIQAFNPFLETSHAWSKRLYCLPTGIATKSSPLPNSCYRTAQLKIMEYNNFYLQLRKLMTTLSAFSSLQQTQCLPGFLSCPRADSQLLTKTWHVSPQCWLAVCRNLAGIRLGRFSGYVQVLLPLWRLRGRKCSRIRIKQ